MKKTIFFAVVAAFLSACDKPAVEPVQPEPGTQTEQKEELLPVNISMGLLTKVTDTEFEIGDQVGLYMVNQPESLQTSGNHYDNMLHTLVDGWWWMPAQDMYWKDRVTFVSFYCYSPYSEVTDVESHAFTVAADQSDLASLKASDFVWGKLENVTPTKERLTVMTNHVMSTIRIFVEAGEGFTNESLAASDIQVKVRNVKNEALVNLADGSVTATGSTVNMTPYCDNGFYRAVVVPQTVADGTALIAITVNGTEYILKKGFTFVSGKRHKFTVTVNKTGSGVNVGIGDWEEDEEDHGGSAE